MNSANLRMRSLHFRESLHQNGFHLQIFARPQRSSLASLKRSKVICTGVREIGFQAVPDVDNRQSKISRFGGHFDPPNFGTLANLRTLTWFSVYYS